MFLLLLAVLRGVASAQPVTGVPLTVFTNPTPEFSEYFGWATAALGTERVLIGAYRDNSLRIPGASFAGAAYLFNTRGDLLTTFANPRPSAGAEFGWAVAAVGESHVLIGAKNAAIGGFGSGAAFLLNTNGVLLTTFTNPIQTSASTFGFALAPVGHDRVLIGAVGDDTGAGNAGSAYLFATNGTLLATFNNPSPAETDDFGYSLAAVGNDAVIIGTPFDDVGATNSGVAYLMNTNGALITVFTNPLPAIGAAFGIQVAAIGRDRVVIGSPYDDTGAIDSGVVHLFGTNGLLLTTITNPAPVIAGSFGLSVAVLGRDKVLVGANGNDGGAANAGVAYLFNTNGALLTVFTNPFPASGDNFGISVTALGYDKVVIGSDRDDSPLPDTGSAYLFNVPYPSLAIGRRTIDVSVSWVTPESGLILQQAGRLGTLADWQDVTGSISVTGPTNMIQQPFATTNRFYRLRRP